MAANDHSLWKLLMARNSLGLIKLSCAECFQLFEYDADLLAAGSDWDEILPVIVQHFEACSGCRQAVEGWIDQLEIAESSQGEES